jgi:hypothetical protein
MVLAGSKMRRSTDHIITRKLTKVMKAPIADDRRKGLSLKLVMPSMAKRSRPPGEKWVRPASRPLRSYGNGHWRNPSHATMPGRYRFSSRIDRSASTTLRSMSRKSPTSRGNGVSDNLAMSR